MALTGTGLTVTLDDAPAGALDKTYPGLPQPTPDDLVVHQQDLQAVVNALWSGGAVAVKLMDQRIISTSAVRCVGNVLILQDRVYSPPYSVTAVGDVTKMEKAIGQNKAISNYLEYVAGIWSWLAPEEAPAGHRAGVLRLPGTSLRGGGRVSDGDRDGPVRAEAPRSAGTPRFTW